MIATLDYAAVVVFALTGALVASRAQLDIIGFFFIACLTAVGGGTVRDLLLNRGPVFWLADPTHIALACSAALVVFFAAPFLESRYRVLVWLDAAALSIAVAAGVSVATALGQSAPVVLVMGIITGTFGGLMRDVVCNEVPLVLKQGELYVTAAFAGAAATLIVPIFLAGPLAPAIACIATSFALRAGSIAFGWRLPVYRSRPPRQ